MWQTWQEGPGQRDRGRPFGSGAWGAIARRSVSPVDSGAVHTTIIAVRTRRSFLQLGPGAALWALAPGAALTSGAALVPGAALARVRGLVQPARPGYGVARAPGSPARVVVVRSARVMGERHRVDQRRLWKMLELGLSRLAGTRDARAALSRWVRPADTVGLKVNCLAGPRMSTHRELTEALVGLLARTGLPRKSAIVFDRSDLDLRQAGYPISVRGADYRSMGNDRAGYDRDLKVMPSGASRFSRVATHMASVLINLPILKDHGLAGISGALKNNFGLVHNPNKLHRNGCDPHVAEVNSWDFVHRKQRLVVCDALRVQVEGGPAFHPAGAMDHGAILLATDPVALDMVAWHLLERLRRKRKLPSLERDRRKPRHILTAGKQRLGIADRSRIQLIELTVS